MPGLSVRLRAPSLVLGLVVPLVVGAPARPQEASPSPPPTFELQEVEVAGKRPQLPSTTPASISVITADEIAAMGTALTVADVLRVLPEVLIKDSGGPGSFTSVSIRGQASARVLILLDGVPLNRPDQPSVDLSTLPIQNVDHIEVLRGPFSAIYGSAALGGVVNIVTRAGPKGWASSRAGSFGESSNTVTLGGQMDNLTYLFQGILTGSTGFAPDTDYSNFTVMPKLHWQTADDAGVTFTVNRLWHVVGSPGPTTFTQDFLARTWEGRTLVDLAWQAGRPGGPGSMFRVYTLDDDVAFSSPGSSFQSDDVAHLLGAQAQIISTPWPGHLLTLGAEYQNQIIAHTDNTPPPPPSAFAGRNTDLGLYVQDDWQAGEHALFSAGVREDIFALYGTQVNPRAGVVVLLNDRLSLRAGAGRTFRAPSFDELLFPGCSNSALQPESAWSYDLGLEYSLAPGLAAHLTGYYTDATNLITSGCPPMNIGHATVAGGSVEVVGRMSDRWFIRANYTNQLARDLATGLDVVYVPRNLGNFEITYQLAPGSSLNVIASFVGDRFDNSTGTRVLVPGYWLTSLTVKWPVGEGFALEAGVANLFDVPYQESFGFPEPGRRYFVSATKNF